MSNFEFINSLKDEIERVRKKDIAYIKKSEEKMKEDTFKTKVTDITLAMEGRIFGISEVLKNYVGDNVGDKVLEYIVGQNFSQALVISVLKDIDFIAFLITSHLVQRTADLTNKSNGRLKLRLYLAILTFDNYKKSKWSD